MLIGASAALAYAGAAAGSGLAFKMYYALGAAMLPGWIGVGSLEVVFSRRVVRPAAVFILVLSALQIGLTLPASVDLGALTNLHGGNGAGVLAPGGWIAPTVLFNTFGLGFAAVAAFFGWWRAFKVLRPSTAAVAVGLSMVVLGVLCRSDAVYRVMVDLGAGSAFLLADAVAFGLIWAGAAVVRELPKPLLRLLTAGGRATAGEPSA